MVFFVCGGCGAALKKNQVENHSFRCRSSQSLTCMDCSKEFWGNDYADHKSCVTENEKYGGNNYVGKEAKGQKKQEEWVTLLKDKINNTKDINEELKNLFNRLLQFDNIPRKRAKFMNFLRNSHFRNEALAEEAWTYFEEIHNMLKTTPKPNPNPNQSNADSQKMEEKDCSAPEVDSPVPTEDTPVDAQRKSKRERKEERKKNQTKVQKKDKKKRKMEDQSEGQESEKPKKKKKKVAGVDEESNQENVKPENGLDESMVTEEKEAEGTSNHIPFKWNKAICTVLKDAPEEGMKIKHVKRKLFSLYMESKSEAAHRKSDIEINALIAKKLERRSDKYVVNKERVKLRSTS